MQPQRPQIKKCQNSKRFLLNFCLLFAEFFCFILKLYDSTYACLIHFFMGFPVSTLYICSVMDSYLMFSNNLTCGLLSIEANMTWQRSKQIFLNLAGRHQMIIGRGSHNLMDRKEKSPKTFKNGQKLQKIIKKQSKQQRSKQIFLNLAGRHQMIIGRGSYNLMDE